MMRPMGLNKVILRLGDRWWQWRCGGDCSGGIGVVVT